MGLGERRDHRRRRELHHHADCRPPTCASRSMTARTSQYTDQWYDNADSFESSTPLVLTPGQTRTGVDAHLEAGIAVSGRVDRHRRQPARGDQRVGEPDRPGERCGRGRPTLTASTRRARSPPATTACSSPPTAPIPSGRPSTGTSSRRGTRRPSSPSPAPTSPTRTGIDAVLDTRGDRRRHGDGPRRRACARRVRERGDRDTRTASTAPAARRPTPTGPTRSTASPPFPVKIYFQDCNHTGPYVDQWWDAPARRLDGGDDHARSPARRQPGSTPTLTAAGVDPRPRHRHRRPPARRHLRAGDDSAPGSADSPHRRQRRLRDHRQPCRAATRCSSSTAPTTRRSPGSGGTTSRARQPRGRDRRPGQIGRAASTRRSHRERSGTISGTGREPAGSRDDDCVRRRLPPGSVRALRAGATRTAPTRSPAFPSGTYALAALGCGGGDPHRSVTDPDVTDRQLHGSGGTRSRSHFEQANQGGPDPIAPGRDARDRSRPAQQLTGYDWCFGCTAISITGVDPDVRLAHGRVRRTRTRKSRSPCVGHRHGSTHVFGDVHLEQRRRERDGHQQRGRPDHRRWPDPRCGRTRVRSSQ